MNVAADPEKRMKPPVAMGVGSWVRAMGFPSRAYLAGTVIAASVALLAASVSVRVAALKSMASAPILSYDPTTGISTTRHEAIMRFASEGGPMACTYASVRSPITAVICPYGYGAIIGGCDGGIPGDLLVTWRGTGWACPETASSKRGVVNASALCCKYGRP